MRLFARIASPELRRTGSESAEALELIATRFSMRQSSPGSCLLRFVRSRVLDSCLCQPPPVLRKTLLCQPPRLQQSFHLRLQLQVTPYRHSENAQTPAVGPVRRD